MLFEEELGVLCKEINALTGLTYKTVPDYMYPDAWVELMVIDSVGKTRVIHRKPAYGIVEDLKELLFAARATHQKAQRQYVPGM